MRPTLSALPVLACAATALTSSLSAQCRPAPGSNEAKLLAFYSAPIAYSADAPLVSLTPGAIRLSFEGSLVPTPSASLQHTGACFVSKSEDTHLSPFFGRPRIAIGLPKGLAFELSYIPPIRVADAKPNLLSSALSFTKPIRGTTKLTLRAHGTVGSVRGPITCPSKSLQQTDPNAPCYGTQESEDTFRPKMFGGEVMVSSAPVGDRWLFSGGIGVNALRPRFRVGFNGTTYKDRTLVEVDLNRFTAFGGVTARLSHKCDVTGQIYSSPVDVTTGRLIAGCRVR